MVYPHALPELIDDFYFEIDYSLPIAICLLAIKDEL